MQRKVKAMSSAAAVIRLSITTATPPAITPIERRAKTTGSTKSNVTKPSAGRAYRRRRRGAGTCAKRSETLALHDRDPGHEDDEEHPTRDGDGNLRRREREGEDRHNRDVHEGHRNESLPAEAHELVDPKPRKRRPDPHHDEDERVDLEREPKNAEQWDRFDARSLPAAEPEGGHDRADDGDVAVFRKGQHRSPAHARVLGEPSGHELGLGLG